MNATSATDHIWWLASRASGIVALLLVTISVVIGLAMAGKIARRPGWPRALLAVHEQTALAGLVAIAVHGITLLGDAWLHPGVAQLTIPFAMGYRTFFTGLGIIAGYLAALLGLSFYVRRRIGTQLWRKLHRATIFVYLAGVVHALGAGTDASTPWLRAYLLGSLALVVPLFLFRIGQSRSRPALTRPEPRVDPHRPASSARRRAGTEAGAARISA